MDWDIEKIRKMVEREMFSTVMLSRILLYYASEDRSELARLMSVASTRELHRVHDVLSLYPQTDVGWRALPADYDSVMNSGLSRAELADLEVRQTQKDREAVEFLREAIHPTNLV